MALRHAVASGHYWASQAGLQILEAGGNAVDAGVAVGLATGVLESEFVGIAGIAPILLYLADRDEVLTISGTGVWPKAASCEYFQRHHGGVIPVSITATVVPPAPGAWIRALAEFGTMSFGQAAAAAIRFARDGFPMYPFLSKIITEQAGLLGQWPSSREVYLPDGRPPAPGEIFRQTDLAKSLQYLVDEEAAHAGKGRKAGLQAAWDAFYRGDIAVAIDRFHRQNGGFLTREDMAAFSVDIEPPCRTHYGDIEVYTCGPWSQGPSMLEALNILEGIDLEAMGHNSRDYVHAVAETVKLVAADREAYFGDPKFVDVPIETLLSKAYATERRGMIRRDQAWPDMPEPGRVTGRKWPTAAELLAGRRASRPGRDAPAIPAEQDAASFDTSYFCVVDRHGNMFSATPSDGAYKAPLVPGTGLLPSLRGLCSWPDPDHPSSVAPGKRPRTTMGPALAIRDGAMFMPFGTPGADVQHQTMLQVFLNIVVFGMDPQSAVEAPRFASYSFPNSFSPHAHYPGRLNLEARIPKEVGAGLADMGHKVEWWGDWAWPAGSSCAILVDRETGVRTAAADPRRTAYAVGW